MRMVKLLMKMPMYLTMIQLEDKPLNSVKITGKIQGLKWQDQRPKKMINIYVNALRLVGLK
jgi:hypothetical protein